MRTRRWSSIGLVLITLALFFGVSFGMQEIVKMVRPDIMKVNPWDVFEGIITIPSYIVIVLLVLLPSDARYNLRLSIFHYRLRTLDHSRDGRSGICGVRPDRQPDPQSLE